MSIVDDKTYPRLTANPSRPYHPSKKENKISPRIINIVVIFKTKHVHRCQFEMSTLVAKEQSQAYSNGHAQSSEVGKRILLLLMV